MDNDLKLQLEMTKSNTYTLKVSQNDKEVYLHSKYNPSKEAETWAQGFYEPGKLFIMIGNGLGYYSKALVGRMGHQDHLLIIEPSKGISELAADHVDSKTMEDKRVFFSFAEDRENLQNICSHLIKKQLFSNTKIFIAPNYDKFFAVNKIVEQLKTEIVAHNTKIVTLRLFSKSWQENYLQNIKFAVNSCPITNFENIFNIPAVIVSSGPSLTLELENLKKLSNHALIICAGSAAPILFKNNITPHLIVSADGGIYNYHHFEEVKYENVPLFYAPTIHYKILEKYTGAKVIFQLSGNDITGWYNELIGFETGIIAVGPSVANCALDIASRMTNGPICFIGQDLGYTGGASHAEGNKYRHDLSLIKQEKQLMLVEANDGGELYADYPFILMKEWFENYLKIYSKGQVYNATLKGAKINGTTVIEFAKFIDNYCQEEINIKKTMDDILAAWNKDKPIAATDDIRRNIVACVSELIDLTSKAKNLSKKLLNKVKNDDYSDINKILNKLSKLDIKIKALKEKDGLLYFIMQPLMEKMDAWNEEDNDEMKKELQIAEKGYVFYYELNKMSQEVKKMLVDSGF